jgi:hypothetical protein
MSVQATGENTVLDVNLSAGVYLISVNVDGKQITKKIVIE